MNRQMLFVSLLVLIAYYVFSYKIEKLTSLGCPSGQHKCLWEDCNWNTCQDPDCCREEYCQATCNPGDRQLD